MSYAIPKIVVFFFAMLFYACDGEVSQNVCEQSLPEDLVVTIDQMNLSARYVCPTMRYDHGILGDAIEAGGLEVTINQETFLHLVDSNSVFEDLVPRVAYVKSSKFPQIITILTDINKGAKIQIFQLSQDGIFPLAASRPIGRTYRWLNIAGMLDWDNDGKQEIAWVETPHIGGTLKVGHVEGDSIEVIDSLKGFSNHQIYSRNLDLSVVQNRDGRPILWLPNDAYNKVYGVVFNEKKLHIFDSLQIDINPILSLKEQIQDLL